MGRVARTRNMEIDPTSERQSEDFWHSFAGQNFVIKRTFLQVEKCEDAEHEAELGVARGRVRSQSDTVLDMRESDESQFKFPVCDYLNSRRTITGNGESEDEKVDSKLPENAEPDQDEDDHEFMKQNVQVKIDGEDDMLEESSLEDPTSMEEAECGTIQVEAPGAHSCWESGQKQHEEISAYQNTSLPMVALPGPMAFQNCIPQGERMMFVPASNVSQFCCMVTMPAYFPRGYDMMGAVTPGEGIASAEQNLAELERARRNLDQQISKASFEAQQAKVDLCGSPQLTVPPSPVLCSEAAPIWSAEDFDARATELLLAAEQCKTVARQMSAAAHSKAGHSSGNQHPRRKKTKQLRSITHQETVMTTDLTTLMFRNIPNNMTRDEFEDLLKSSGFAGRYNFLYLPWDFHRLAGLGYAFVNFQTYEYARSASEYFHFQTFTECGFNSDKLCEVCWSSPLQGLDAHVERYRDSPVMHKDVPAEYKPLLFINGDRTPFPPPTKKIRPPRMKRCAPFTHRAAKTPGLAE